MLALDGDEVGDEHQVFVAERGLRAGFHEEAGREPRAVEHLQRVPRPEPFVHDEPHLSHRARAEDPLEPVAAVDRRGLLLLNSANALIVEKGDEDYLAALLNSPPVRLMHRARVTLPRVLRSHLQELALPAASPRVEREIGDLVRAHEFARANEAIMDLYRLSPSERAWMARWLS